MGPLADAVPDSVASRSATPPAGVVEGAVPLVFGSMVVAVGLGRSADATTDEPPTTTTRRNENDAGGRPPFGNGNQDDPGRVMRNAVSGGNPAHHLAIDFHPFVILSFFLSSVSHPGIDEQVQAAFTRRERVRLFKGDSSLQTRSRTSVVLFHFFNERCGQISIFFFL